MSAVVAGIILMAAPGVLALIRSNSRLLIWAVPGIVLVAAPFVFRILKYRSAPVRLDISGWWLAVTGVNTSIRGVTGFQARIINQRRHPIDQISGYIRSDLTNATFPMYFLVDGLLVRPEETYGIPAKGKSSIFVPFREDTAEIEIDEFIRTTGAFTLQLTVGGKTIEYPFSLQKNQEYLQSFRQHMERSIGLPQPHIVRKRT